MITERVTKALNDQINAEFWSAYLYLSMSTYCADKGLPGFASWFYSQFQEEQFHAFKLLNYVQARGARVELKAIEAVKTEWASVLEVFEDTLAHEKVVTSLINDMYHIAVEEKDLPTQSLLRWFIDEQVEEEEAAQEKIDALRLIGDNGYGLYMFDKELATRVFTAPTKE